MNTRRLLSVAAVAAASAMLALAGAGGDALASNGNAAATSQIKACYKTGSTPVPLNHISNSATCPAGNTTLTWNKTGPAGPPGPAGMSFGASASNNTAIILDQGGTMVGVMSTSPVSQTGTYYVNASVGVSVAQGDTVVCAFFVGSATVGDFATTGPAVQATSQTLPLTASLNLAAGQALAVTCTDYTANPATSFTNGALTAVLISNATGNTRTKVLFRRGLPSH